MRILKFQIIFMFVLLFASATARAQSEYTRANLWEKEINAFAEADKKEFPPEKAVLFVGSSSIRGWRTLKEDFPDFKIINRGFGGSHLEDVLYYAKQIVLPYKPKLIVLYAGENDLVAGKSVERVFEDYKKIVALVHKELPKTRLIFVSIKPSPARMTFIEKFRAANALIKAETGKNKRTLFVDVSGAMLDADGKPKPEIFLGDGIHLKPEGYRIWREILAPIIKRGLKKNFR